MLHFLGKPIPADMPGCSLLSTERELARCPARISSTHGLRSEAFDRVLAHPVKSLGALDRCSDQLAQWRRFRADLAVTTRDRRYLLDMGAGAERLYARTGPSEQGKNLVRSEPSTLARMREQLARLQRAEALRIRCALR